MISIYDVLKASKGIHVDDTFADLWGRKLSNAYTVATYTGTLPATLQTVRGYLVSYKIYGNTVQSGTPTPENPIMPIGCGERTENLFNGQGTDNYGYYDNANGQYVNDSRYKYWRFPVNEGDIIRWTRSNAGYGCYFSNGVYMGSFRNTENPFTVPAGVDEITSNFRVSVAESAMVTKNQPLPDQYIPYGYKLPLTSGSTSVDIYIGDDMLSAEEYVDSSTGKIYRRTKNLSPPEEEWIDGQIGGDGIVQPSTQIKVSPFIDVSTCETCIMEVFSAETEWATAGYREMAFYDENKQYLGWIGGGGRQALTPNSTERLSEFPAGTVYVRIGCSHGDQPFYPQLVSGYTPVHRFYPYHVLTDPPAPFPQIPTATGTTIIDYNGTPKPDKVELTYRKPKGQ